MLIYKWNRFQFKWSTINIGEAVTHAGHVHLARIGGDTTGWDSSAPFISLSAFNPLFASSNIFIIEMIHLKQFIWNSSAIKHVLLSDGKSGLMRVEC